MDTVILRERLHKYIDTADERHLAAIYVLLEKEIGAGDVYDKALMDELYRRRESHLNDSSKSYTAEDALKQIRQQKK
jgi:hypothetical protein